MHALRNDTKKKIGVYFTKWKYSQLECFGHFRNIFSKYIKNLMVSFNSSWKTKQFDTQHVWLNFNRSWIDSHHLEQYFLVIVSSITHHNESGIKQCGFFLQIRPKYLVNSEKNGRYFLQKVTCFKQKWQLWSQHQTDMADFFTDALESHQFAAVEFSLNLFLQF